MKVIELFSGIGGMHFALKETGNPAEVLLAADINPVANEIYTCNFPNIKLLNRNIQSLTAEFLNKLEADTILMSPPCQPFTRNGLKGDTNDPRTAAFLHILKILPQLNICKILVENVKGFEGSNMRNLFVEVLEKCGFCYQEFMLTPTQFGVPNSRLRYYCLAKKLPDKFMFDTGPLLEFIPNEEANAECFEIKNVVEHLDNEEYNLSPKILERYWKVLDVVQGKSRRSCCFTKAYGRYAEGTGSVYTDVSEETCGGIFDELHKIQDKCKKENLLQSLKLRYFTPKEVSKLQCFPNYFKFPENITDRQKYMVLGNSINVQVVSKLIKLLD